MYVYAGRKCECYFATKADNILDNRNIKSNFM